MAVDQELDVMAITETWLHTDDKALCAEIKDIGFDIIHKPRKGRGGGVAIISKHQCNIRPCKTSLKPTSFECQEVVLKIPATRFVVVYRPGNRGDFDRFIEEFETLLLNLSENYEPAIICGDFNIHVEDETDSHAKKFLRLLEDFGWHNIISEPTHIKGGTLDLILTQKLYDDHMELVNVDIMQVPVVPDHFLITCEADIAYQPPPKTSEIICRNMKEISLDTYRDMILSSDLCGDLPEDLEECVNLYNSTLRSILDELAPLEKKVINNIDQARWFTADCQESKRIRRKAERRWKTARLKSTDPKHLTSTFIKWKEACSTATKTINTARNTYYNTRLDKVKDDSKATFAIVNGLLGNEKIPTTLPTTLDQDTLATQFNNFFKSKVSNIYNNIESQSATPPSTEPKLATSSCNLNEFQLVDDEELLKIIKTMQKKHCSLDPLPSTMVGSSLPELLPTLSKIVNGSLQSGTFPQSFKEAIIRPSFKGKGLNAEDLGSYRPISNLSFVSKVVEKCASIQLVEFLEKNKLLPDVQSAYRRFHSCETATLKIMNDLAILLDNKSKAVLLLLDLSAAFDTVQHTTLLSKLKNQYGISGTALAWFRSYLKSRTTSVLIKDNRSEQIDIEIGVPQGSILGPILFIMYTQELQSIASRYGLKIHLFADDTQIYVSFTQNNMEKVIKNIQECLSHIKWWMKVNYLKLNANKTEVLIMHHKVDKTPNPTEIELQKDEPITPCLQARNLGVWFDSTLSMSSHISNIVKACNIQLMNLWRIAKKLSMSLKIKLVNTLIHSRLDYCNGLLYGASKKDLNRLQKIQNSAVRFIYGTRKRRGVTQKRRNLHFLPIQSRIQFKICLLTYKCLNGLAPPYMNNLISRRQPKEHALRVDNDPTILQQNFSHKYKSTEKAFSICAPKLWNSLPRTIREASSVDAFKKLLKTHLFIAAYNNA